MDFIFLHAGLPFFLNFADLRLCPVVLSCSPTLFRWHRVDVQTSHHSHHVSMMLSGLLCVKIKYLIVRDPNIVNKFSVCSCNSSLSIPLETFG
jgi:hypothetical protein